MSIQRYFVWLDEAHEQEDGKFVRLEDIIKLLETYDAAIRRDDLIASIKGENN